MASDEGTGWISEIWKNVQVNIHYTYTASTETNNTSEESPGIQLKNDTLKLRVSSEMFSTEVIEGKKSKTLRAHKIQQNMLFAASGCGALLIMPRLLALKSIVGRGGFLTSVRAGGCGSLMIMPHPFSGCQIKAEIKGFLLRYRLFQ